MIDWPRLLIKCHAGAHDSTFLLHLIRRHIIRRHMIEIEQKHTALLHEAQRRGQHGVENMRLCFEVLALAAAIDRACAHRLAPHGLSEGKFVLLFLLHEKKDGLSPHELAARAGVTRATITGLLDGLEHGGLVARRPDAVDRRKLVISLTTAGEALALDLFNEHSRWIASLFKNFDGPSRNTLSGLLQRARLNVDADTATKQPPRST